MGFKLMKNFIKFLFIILLSNPVFALDIDQQIEQFEQAIPFIKSKNYNLALEKMEKIDYDEENYNNLKAYIHALYADQLLVSKKPRLAVKHYEKAVNLNHEIVNDFSEILLYLIKHWLRMLLLLRISINH